MYAAALHVVAAMAHAVEALDDQRAPTPNLGECMRRSASSRNGTLQPSHHACIGPPCCAPLRRNRTCLFRNLLFLPPARDERQPRRPRTSGFHYLVPLADPDGFDEADGTELGNASGGGLDSSGSSLTPAGVKDETMD